MVAQPIEVPPAAIEEAQGIAASTANVNVDVVSDSELALPDSFLLATLGDRRLRLSEPIAVQITYENDDVIANASDFEEFGFGSNWTEALADLRHALAQLYWSLSADEERLGPDLQRLLERLKSKVQVT